MIVLGGIVGEFGSWIQVVIGVGLLVFIHEAGHFLVAKWAGVRVLAFSLGFGPEMFGFTRGATRYRVSWVPLGGYVKMSGETELPEGGYAPDDYPSQAVWKRALIIVAGVVMNAVLGFVLFAAALGVGLKVDPVVVGTVRHGGVAWEAGLRPGDRIEAAGGHRLVAFQDLMFATIDGNPVELAIVRGTETLRFSLQPRIEEGTKTPAIGVGPGFGSRFVVPPGGTAEKAGFRNGDRIVAAEGIPAGLADFGEEVFAASVVPSEGPLHVVVARDGGEAAVTVDPAPARTRRIGISTPRTTVDLVRAGGPAAAAGWKAGDRPVAVGAKPVAGMFAFRSAVLAKGAATARVARGGGDVDLPLPAEPAGRLALLRDLRFAPPVPRTLVDVLPGSPAEAAGLRSGDRITAVDGKPVNDYPAVVAGIAGAGRGPVAVEWERDGKPGKASILPAEVLAADLFALDFTTEDEREILRASSVGEALSMAGVRCVMTTGQIVSTVTGIFRGSVDKDSLGGPIQIARIAHQSSKEGFGHFLWLLGMLSINLMFLNVLPIPVLDGGQLALLLVEAVTRRRPSEAVVGIAQMAGLVLLLGLMLFISFNDVVRLLR